MNNTSALNLSHSLLNNSNNGQTQPQQTMSMNNLNFYPAQNSIDFQQNTYPEAQHQFAQSMKNVNAKTQNFGGIFNTEDFINARPVEMNPGTNNSMLSSSFLQGFVARRGFAEQQL